jgi:hypothetical protein
LPAIVAVFMTSLSLSGRAVSRAGGVERDGGERRAEELRAKLVSQVPQKAGELRG